MDFMDPAALYVHCSLEDFVRLEGNFELVHGMLQPRPSSAEASRISVTIGARLGEFIHTDRLGALYSASLLVRAFSDSDEIRKASLSYLVTERVPPGDGDFLTIPPDFVVEVVSPFHNAYNVRAKVDVWLNAGVRMVWVAWPAQRELQVYRPGLRCETLVASDIVSGYDVIPGFQIAVASLFD